MEDEQQRTPSDHTETTVSHEDEPDQHGTQEYGRKVEDQSLIPITAEEVIYFMDKKSPRSSDLIVISEEGAVFTYSTTHKSWKSITKIDSSLTHIWYFVSPSQRLTCQRRSMTGMPFVELCHNSFRLTGVARESMNTIVNSEKQNLIALISRKDLTPPGDEPPDVWGLRHATEITVRTLATKKLIRRYYLGFCGFYYCPTFRGDFFCAADAKTLTVIDTKHNRVFRTNYLFDYENSEISQIQVERKGRDSGILWVVVYKNIRDRGIEAQILVCKPSPYTQNNPTEGGKNRGELLSHSTQVVFDCRPHKMQTFSENFGLIFWSRPGEVVLVGDEQVYLFDVLLEDQDQDGRTMQHDVPVWRLKQTLPDVDLTSIVDMGSLGYFFTSWNKLQSL